MKVKQLMAHDKLQCYDVISMVKLIFDDVGKSEKYYHSTSVVKETCC